MKLKKALSGVLAVSMVMSGMSVTTGTMMVQASAKWAWNANYSESGYVKIPYTKLSASADSEQPTGEAASTVDGNVAHGLAANTVDGHVTSYWHTNYNGNNEVNFSANNGNGANNSITVSLKDSETSDIKGVTYLPRQDELGNGYMHQFKIEVQRNGSWTQVTEFESVEDGSATNGVISLNAPSSDKNTYVAGNKHEKEILFKDSYLGATAVKFTVNSVYGANPKFINAAEIGILKNEKNEQQIIADFKVDLKTKLDEVKAYLTEVYGADCVLPEDIKGTITNAENLYASESATTDELRTAKTALENLDYKNCTFRTEVGSGKYLSDITEKSVRVGWDSLRKDLNIQGLGLIRLNTGDGKVTTYKKGLAAHATSEIVYDVENYKMFESMIGVENNANNDGSVVFKIYKSTDGTNYEAEPIYTSGVMQKATKAEKVTLDISDAKLLKLYADQNGSDSNDHAVWADAKVYTSVNCSMQATAEEGGSATVQVGEKEATASAVAATGETVKFQASASENYEFAYWTNEAGEKVSTENPYTFTFASGISAMTLTAHFAQTDRSAYLNDAIQKADAIDWTNYKHGSEYDNFAKVLEEAKALAAGGSDDQEALKTKADELIAAQEEAEKLKVTEISVNASKTVYAAKEQIGKENVTVTATYQNGTSEQVTGTEADEVKITYNPVRGTQTVTVTYRGQSTSFNATILSESYGETKTYTASSEFTQEDIDFMNNLNNITVTVTGKVNKNDNKAYCLFTLEGNDKNCFTVWYNPNKGMMCYTSKEMGTGIFFTGNAGKTDAGKHFKASFSLARLNDGKLYMICSVNGSKSEKSAINMDTKSNWDTFGKNFLDSHKWNAEKVMIGKKPTGIDMTFDKSNGSLSDFDGTISKVVVTNGIYGDSTSTEPAKAADTAPSTAAKNLLAANNKVTEDVALQAKIAEYRKISAYGYELTGWNAFQQLVNDVFGEKYDTSKDWLCLEVMDAMDAAKENLAKRQITVTTAGEHVTCTGAGTYTFGDMVNLSAEPETGYEFKGWKDENGSIVSKDAAYTMLAENNITLTAVCTPEPKENTVTITFKTGDRFSDQICGEPVQAAVGEQITVPAHKNYYGYTFEGWDSNGDGVADIKGTQAEAGAKYTVAEEVTTLLAVYKIEKVTYTVSVTNGNVKGEDSKAANGTYEEGSVVTVTADVAEEGKEFKEWQSDGMVVSTNATYSFIVKKDMNLTAVYADKGSAEVKPVVSFTDCSRKFLTAEDKDQVKMVISWSGVTGCQIVSIGTLRTYDATQGTKDNLVLDNSSTAIKNGKCTKILNSGTFTGSLKIGAANKDKPLYARGYITYKDAQGNIHAVYTDIKTIAHPAE